MTNLSWDLRTTDGNGPFDEHTMMPGDLLLFVSHKQSCHVRLFMTSSRSAWIRKIHSCRLSFDDHWHLNVKVQTLHFTRTRLEAWVSAYSLIWLICYISYCVNTVHLIWTQIPSDPTRCGLVSLHVFAGHVLSVHSGPCLVMMATCSRLMAGFIISSVKYLWRGPFVLPAGSHSWFLTATLWLWASLRLLVS